MLSLLKLSPIMVLLAQIVFFKLDILMAAPIAAVYASFICVWTKKMKFTEVMDKAMGAVGEVIPMLFVTTLALTLADSFMATGVGASVIGLALNLGVTGKNIAVVAYLTCSVFSLATATSWGTFASCAPVFLWLNHIVGGDIVLTTGAIAGGAVVGDCIGFINDMTILSCSVHEIKVVDRVKHQALWTAFTLILTAIVTFFVSQMMGLSSTVVSAQEALKAIPADTLAELAVVRPSAALLLDQVVKGSPVYLILPPILIIILALKGHESMICLGVGIVTSFIFGGVAGNITGIGHALSIVESAFSDAGSWLVMMIMFITLFGAIMNMMDAFEPLSNLIIKISKSVKRLMFCNALLCILGNVGLADETAQIVTIGPIIKKITAENVVGSEEDHYKLRVRNSMLSETLGVIGSLLIPWHTFILFFLSILSTVYPLYEFTFSDIASKCFMAFISVASILIMSFTGIERYIPSLKIPEEPDVYLKSQKNKFEETVIVESKI